MQTSPGDRSTQQISMFVLELPDIVRGLAPAETILAFLSHARFGSNAEGTLGEMMRVEYLNSVGCKDLDP